MSDKLSVVIVDDHPLFREGVASRIGMESDITVVGQGSTAEDAIHLAYDLLPDLLLLDINIPGSGLHAAQSIATGCPVVKIVMLTASEEEDDLVAALKAGARGYILKGVSAPELIRILRAVCAGEVYVSPSLATSLLLEMTGALPGSRTPTSPLSELTDREREILEGVAIGLSNKEIGLRLHLSEKTIKHYMTNVLQKLHVRNRVEAALLARRSGRIEPKS